MSTNRIDDEVASLSRRNPTTGQIEQQGAKPKANTVNKGKTTHSNRPRRSTSNYKSKVTTTQTLLTKIVNNKATSVKGGKQKKITNSPRNDAMTWTRETTKKVAEIGQTLNVNNETKEYYNHHNQKSRKFKKFQFLVTGYDSRKKVVTKPPKPKYLEQQEMYDEWFGDAIRRGNNIGTRDAAKEKLQKAFPVEWDLSFQDSRKSKSPKGEPKGKPDSTGLKDPPNNMADEDPPKTMADEAGTMANDSTKPLIIAHAEMPPRYSFPLVEGHCENMTQSTLNPRINKLLEGDWENLEYNIQPAHPNLPLWMACQIHLVPMTVANNMALSVGSKKAMQRFSKEGEAINLYMDEIQAKQILLGTINKDKSGLQPLSSEANLLKKIEGMDGFGKEKLEVCLGDILKRIEEEMETIGIGKATTMSSWTKWERIPEDWQVVLLTMAIFIQDKNPPAPKKLQSNAKKRLLEPDDSPEARAEEKQKIYNHYNELIGGVPPCEYSTHSFYMMDQWGCEGLRK